MTQWSQDVLWSCLSAGVTHTRTCTHSHLYIDSIFIAHIRIRWGYVTCKRANLSGTRAPLHCVSVLRVSLHNFSVLLSFVSQGLKTKQRSSKLWKHCQCGRRGSPSPHWPPVKIHSSLLPTAKKEKLRRKKCERRL